MKRISAAACALFILDVSDASAATVDWKFYGSGDFEVGRELRFYEANSAVRMKSGLIRVWTKCVPREDMVYRRLIERHIPPISKRLCLLTTKSRWATEVYEMMCKPALLIEAQTTVTTYRTGERMVLIVGICSDGVR